MSLIPSMGICGRSSFAGSYHQFTVDTTSSDIGLDDHGEDPNGIVEFPFLLIFFCNVSSLWFTSNGIAVYYIL